MSMLIVDESESSQRQLLTHLNNSHDIFILMHLASCGPCSLVLPKWNEMTDNLEIQDLLMNNPHIVIATIESSYLQYIHHPEFQNVQLFPTIKHIRGNSCQLLQPDPTNDDVNTYIDWIKNNITKTTTTTGGGSNSLVDQMIQFQPKRKRKSRSRSYRNKTNKKSNRQKNRKSSKNKK